jgi:hypothetical protein
MIQNELNAKFEYQKAPSQYAIDFQMTGSMIDNKKKVVGKKSVRTP